MQILWFTELKCFITDSLYCVAGSIVSTKVVLHIMNEWQHLAYCEADRKLLWTLFVINTEVFDREDGEQFNEKFIRSHNSPRVTEWRWMAGYVEQYNKTEKYNLIGNFQSLRYTKWSKRKWNRIYYYSKVCFRHYDLLNYRRKPSRHTFLES